MNRKSNYLFRPIDEEQEEQVHGARSSPEERSGISSREDDIRFCASTLRAAVGQVRLSKFRSSVDLLIKFYSLETKRR